MTPHPTVHATFIPFEQMTPRQQAEHLVMAHGMGVDYHDGSDGDGLMFVTDGDVIEWYLTSSYWTRKDQRDIAHDDDHDYLAGEEDPLAYVHTHTKTHARPARADGRQCDGHPH